MTIFQKTFFALALSGAPLPLALAQQAPAQVAPKLASKTVFVSGLKEPQGLAFDYQKNLLVADYKTGEILVFDIKDGKALGRVASGLQGPSLLLQNSSQIIVSERKSNRVVLVNSTRTDDPERNVIAMPGEVAEPIGLAFDEKRALWVVSHTTSRIYRRDWPEWVLFHEAPQAQGARYGYRAIAAKNGFLFVSDEVGEQILRIDDTGVATPFATGISDPSGLVFGPDKMLYVANEGDGGQLIRLDSQGRKSIIAEGLGRPRGIAFVDAKTALVANRDGNVWKLAF